jgi:hypothetical protein
MEEMMVTVSIQGEKGIFQVEGLDKVWAFKNRVEVELGNIVDVYRDPTIARGWWQGWRLPGTHLPGVIVAGTFYKNGKRIFWDVHKAANAIVIELQNEDYDRLVIETNAPEETIEMLKRMKSEV